MLRTDRSVAENLERLQHSIAETAVRAGRQPHEITLVGVSKTHPAELVVEAVQAGLLHFGENRVQEAAEKIPLIKNRTPGQPAVFHMIGHLQSNKAGIAVGLFDSIDSVDSLRVAQALSRRVLVDGGGDLAVRLEVYVGDDSHRPGLRPDQLAEVTGRILELQGLRVEGLMTIAPLGGDARAAFARVRGLKLELARTFPRVHFGVLSMGMSEDYVSAIEEGSTEVRIGRALFGARES